MTIACAEQYEHWLQILMMVSGFVLLIVCANIANLMLAGAHGTEKKTSLSMALGAQASVAMRQALTESVLLSLLGGAAGLAIAFACTRLILHFAFPQAVASTSMPISAAPSMPVLLFAFGVSLITGVAFGIAPAWMATRVDPMEALRGASRSTARTGSLALKGYASWVFQAALSLVLLSASGLLSQPRCTTWSIKNFGFEQDRRAGSEHESTACRLPDRPTLITLPAHPRFHGLLRLMPYRLVALWPNTHR